MYKKWGAVVKRHNPSLESGLNPRGGGIYKETQPIQRQSVQGLGLVRSTPSRS